MTLNPDWVIKPGETLMDWMTEGRVHPITMSGICGLPVDAIEGIIDGSVEITPEIAEGLFRGTKISAQLWLNLEKAYRDGLAAGKSEL